MIGRGEVEALAIAAFGEPNPAMSTHCELRFGRNGSMSVHLLKGCYYSFETGEHGGLKALAALAGEAPPATARTALERREAAEWQDRDAADELRKLSQADELWRQAGPLGPAAHDYYQRRGINVKAIPDVDALRFHPRTPWGDERAPCILGRFTDVLTGAPRGITRRRIDRKVKPRTLGPSSGCVVRLWPDEVVETRLVVGEGIETVLAAATRIPYRGGQLAPAWATVTTPNENNLPVLAGIGVLLLLVDADVSRAGQHAAEVCAQRWVAAGCEVIRLTPKELGFDFNDIVMAGSP